MPGLSPNQLNHNEITDQENNINTTEQKTQHLSRLQNEIGSKVLSLVNFESKHKDIVESSFNKARNNKEKLPGKNNERRNFAYLSRLNNIVEKYGDKAEQKLWEASAENLVMDYEDIPDAYWKQQEQILRDNGQGRELSRYEKEILAEDLIDKQRQSITSWTNYLGDKNCPYPLWFKVYAFDGISKMSNTLNLDDADYNRRDNTTALSFPKLNAEILAKVYRQINDFYGVDKENWLAQHSDDEKLVSLVKSANFPKLYAKELVDTKVILKTPERTEDVHGDWFEYKLGDEEEIASLAEGTKWCIVDPNVAHNYLVYGQYSNPEEEDDDYDQDYGDEDWEDDNIKVENPEAKFIIFRLEDPNSPGIYASNGSASIRLDPNGIVDEVSGLNEGQADEDALVPIVKEKALSPPGGEKYLQKFDDKQALIRLDKKMEKGEDLTKEELSFIYELDRPIATLDTYNEEDPRIPELKEKYGIEYALEKGIDANKMVSSLDSGGIEENLDFLLEHDADINNIVNKIHSYGVVRNLDYLLKNGADINNVVRNMYSEDVVRNLDYLLKNGADINDVVRNMYSGDVVRNLDYFLKNGADINNAVNNMDHYGIADNLGYLLKNGADINNIVNHMKPYDVAKNLDTLFEHGAKIDVDELVSNIHSNFIFKNLKSLINHGANIDNIVKEMNPNDIAMKLDILLEHGANINLDELVSSLEPEDFNYYALTALLKHKADVNLIVEGVGPHDITNNLDLLLKHGVDINVVTSKMYPYDIVYKLDFFIERGAIININELVSNLNPGDISRNLDSLIKHGANIDINKLVPDLYTGDILYGHNLESLLKHGADVNLIIKKLKERDINDHIDPPREYGANL